MTPRASSRARPPVTQWVLVGAGVVVLAILLGLHGYTAGASADDESSVATRSMVGRPAPLAGAGPIIDFPGGEPRSAGMPDRTIALTFDDGPDPKWTPQILDALEEHGARATFFPIGANVAAHPELTRRILAEGHEIGSHTYSHARWEPLPPWRQDLELELFQKVLAGTTDRLTRLFRPPYSAGVSAVDSREYQALRRAGRAGYVVVLADQITDDWFGRDVGQLVRSARPSGTKGGVVMLHDAGGDRSATVAAVRVLLSELTAAGYRFTTVSEGLGEQPAIAPADPLERSSGAVLVLAHRASRLVSRGLTVAVGTAASLAVVRFVVLIALARRHRRNARGDRGRGQDAASPYTPAVSIIVPAYNEAAGIAATVTSLVHTTYPGDLEVLVVDDGSTDGTARIVTDLGLPNVTVVCRPNAGKAGALRVGTGLSHGEILVMVDADTVFEPTTVPRLVAPLADPRVGAVSGNTKVGNRARLLGRWQHLEYVTGFNLDRRMFDVLQCMPTVPGAVGAFRRAAVDAVGGVDDGTLAEDTDLTMALGRQGWRVVYADDATAWTEAPVSLAQLWRQRYRWCYGTLQAMWKHKHSLVAPGPGGRFGRRCLSYLGIFQLALPLLAPAVDVFACYSLLVGDGSLVVGVWLVFTALQTVACGYALVLDGESLRALWALPLQQFVYRQLIYLVTIQSVATAVMGAPLRWHGVERQGIFGGQGPNRHSVC